MNLVIVESPTKAKTISRFLGSEFRVESSFGHVRDLPAYKLGVDVEKGFEPQYVTPRRAQPNVKKLKELVKTATKLILATDEDREGEAIAWHLVHALGLGDSDTKTSNSKQTTKLNPPIRQLANGQVPSIERIAFHEITKRAIEEALNNPRGINENLVNAQQTRRILDRLVGYKLSPFLWKKIMRGLSAGRVQSVAVRLIVEREKEIRAFNPETYWTIEAMLQKPRCQNEDSPDCKSFTAALSEINEKIIEKPGLKNEDETKKIAKELETAELTILQIEEKTQERSPKAPFTTSTLQQESWSRLKFSAKKTMMIAQQLYEGINIKSEGHTGLITYMRTDSVNLSEDALKQAREYISASLGPEYALDSPRRFKTKSKNAQEAHEAIRPTRADISPNDIKNDLTQDQYRLYNIIWRRFLGSQMPNAVFGQTAVVIEARPKTGDTTYKLRSGGSILKFDGFLKMTPAAFEDIVLPRLNEKDLLEAKQIDTLKHQTQPLPRYTEASLIKALEKFGIGRPSTYAPIMSVIQERGYVIKNEAKQLVPSEIGEKVNDMLVENFPKIVDVDFTAHMEEELDLIAAGEKNSKDILEEFYGPFAENLKEKYETVEKENLIQETDEKCPNCGKTLIIRHGRFGKFIACSGFPECKFTKSLTPEPLNIKCPKCQSGDVVQRRTKRKRIFYGCSRYPNCDFATWQKPTGELCPKCGNALIQMRDYIKCSSKECEYKK